MGTPDSLTTLHRYLRSHREAVLWKLEGLSEGDQRRPVTPTGTNLLGLVKHLATMEAGYLGEVFGRPFPEPMPWMEPGAEDNADLWATPDESPDDIVALYRRASAHADATIEELGADGVGHVAWWAPHGDVTVQEVLVHLLAETARHAGHADLVRETLDGGAGLRPDADNLPQHDDAWWRAYVARLESIADASG